MYRDKKKNNKNLDGVVKGNRRTEDNNNNSEISPIIDGNEVDVNNDALSCDKATEHANPPIVIPNIGMYTDPRDGKEYRTVLMPDGKEWFAENLNYEIESSWYYDDNPANGRKCGRLYTWDAAIKASTGLGDGWRLPSDSDWKTLVEAIGGVETAGTKLKSQVGWCNNGNGTDDYRFSAQPCGHRRPAAGIFDDAGCGGYWWSASEDDMGGAWVRLMGYDEGMWSSDFNKNYGFSVRCIRDVQSERTAK